MHDAMTNVTLDVVILTVEVELNVSVIVVVIVLVARISELHNEASRERRMPLPSLPVLQQNGSLLPSFPKPWDD